MTGNSNPDSGLKKVKYSMGTIIALIFQRNHQEDKDTPILVDKRNVCFRKTN